ncbi:MAG TPA: Crp/Fnr family transcriptional regulator [Sedimenticola thiotaurini]|uniref:Crp/Fnr family transcriptional regulator n=1 Tax=Sedimenticola thiotaurini TaxID=1543721 RepID=A0A831RJT2_9GAMM|nr:Crp/Fnr family transcriptional regulator [Sedimenticola thiotaurini]
MISDPDNRQRLEERFPFLGRADPAFRRQLLQHASLVRLEQGQYICHEGHACPHLALVIEGTARVFKLGDSGREITLYRVEPGQSCILTASCILSRQPFPALASCDTDLTAAVVSATLVKRWLAESEDWRDYIFGLIAGRLASIISVVEEVAFRRMDRRIADYLIHRAGQGETLLHATHQQIASDLGTSREVVSRILKDFDSSGLLRVRRGTIQLLDRGGLAARSGNT